MTLSRRVNFLFKCQNTVSCRELGNQERPVLKLNQIVGILPFDDRHILFRVRSMSVFHLDKGIKQLLLQNLKLKWKNLTGEILKPIVYSNN